MPGNRQTLGGALLFLGSVIFINAIPPSTDPLRSETIIISTIVVGFGLRLTIGLKKEILAGAVLGLTAFWFATRVSGAGGACTGNFFHYCPYLAGFPWRFYDIGWEWTFEFIFTRFLADLIVFILPGMILGWYVGKFVNRVS
jgi:hypothetical protein